MHMFMLSREKIHNWGFKLEIKLMAHLFYFLFFKRAVIGALSPFTF
jgi:hypothetical protein